MAIAKDTHASLPAWCQRDGGGLGNQATAMTGYWSTTATSNVLLIATLYCGEVFSGIAISGDGLTWELRAVNPEGSLYLYTAWAPTGVQNKRTIITCTPGTNQISFGWVMTALTGCGRNVGASVKFAGNSVNYYESISCPTSIAGSVIVGGFFDTESSTDFATDGGMLVGRANARGNYGDLGLFMGGPYATPGTYTIGGYAWKYAWNYYFACAVEILPDVSQVVTTAQTTGYNTGYSAGYDAKTFNVSSITADDSQVTINFDQNIGVGSPTLTASGTKIQAGNVVSVGPNGIRIPLSLLLKLRNKFHGFFDLS